MTKKLFIFAKHYLRSNFSRTVKFAIRLEHGKLPDNDYYYLTFKGPFYDEKKHFYFGFNIINFDISFVPVETITLVMKELLSNKYLIQTEWDFAKPNTSDSFLDSLKTIKKKSKNGKNYLQEI